MKAKQNGFTVIEGLLILVILGVIGFTGYYVWHSKQQTDKTLNSAQSESTVAKPIKKASDTATVAEANVTVVQDKIPAGWTIPQQNAGGVVLVLAGPDGAGPIICYAQAIKSPDPAAKAANANSYSQVLYTNQNNSLAADKGYVATVQPKSTLTISTDKGNKQLVSFSTALTLSGNPSSDSYQKSAYIIRDGYNILITASCNTANAVPQAETALQAIKITGY